jgi:7-cyano-7-deazaguanine synthase
MVKKKAVVLLSGGLDSAVTLYWAIKKGYKCSALIFDYNQRHKKEILSAKKIADICKVPYTVFNLNFPWKGSSLLDKNVKIPVNKKIGKNIPSTYVPSRNIIFLSIASSYADVFGAHNIFIGANSIDYSGYPDCRESFLKSMQKTLNVGTKIGKNFRINAPLLHLTKKQIISLGAKLKVPFDITWSCYAGGKTPCGVCDSCKIRNEAFNSLK